jgi:hypothetical protein
MFKKTLWLAIPFLALLGTSVSFAADITWGKTEVFKISKISYNGKNYSGSLIASDTAPYFNGHGQDLTNPGVLVRGLRFGLDEVVPLVAVTKSPLCLNLGYAYTSMWFQPPTVPSKVAVFASAQEVVIYDLRTWLEMPENATYRQTGVPLADQRLTCVKSKSGPGND